VKQLLCCSHTGSFNRFLQLAYLLIPFSDFSIVRGLWNNGGLHVLCSHASMYVWMYACMHKCMYISVCVCIYACMYACVKIKKIKSKIFYSHKTVTLMNINNISKTVICKNKARGHPFMTSTKKSGLWPLPLSTCVHVGRTPSPLWTSTRGRHEIHIALLKWLVQWPTGPKAEIRLYDSNLFKLNY